MADNMKERPKRKTLHPKVTQNRPLKWFYITLGTVAVALGFLGIFLPLLPTTAFLLLAAWAYARSSHRFYHWLLNNRIFGKYITAYLEGKGMPMISKVSTTLLLWITILATTIFFVENIWIRILLLAIAVGVTLHIIMLPTMKRENKKLKKASFKENLTSS